MQRLKFLPLAIAFVLACPAYSYAQTAANEIVGAWKIVSVETKTSDGKASPLYGDSVGGLIVYDQSGAISAHLMNLATPRCGTMDRRKCPDSAARGAFDNYLGYWGKYELLRDERAVVHHVEGASHPDWIGSTQKRFFQVSADRIVITTPPLMVRGVEESVVIIVTAERLRQ